MLFFCLKALISKAFWLLSTPAAAKQNDSLLPTQTAKVLGSSGLSFDLWVLFNLWAIVYFPLFQLLSPPQLLPNPTKPVAITIFSCYNRTGKITSNSGVRTMNMDFEENWIGISEAATHLGVTKDTIRNWIKKTDIPAHKIGKLWKFKRSELDEWVKSGKSAIV